MISSSLRRQGWPGCGVARLSSLGSGGRSRYDLRVASCACGLTTATLSVVVRSLVGRHTPIQRCQVHKARNISERLPKPLHACFRKALRQTWELDNADKAEKLIRNLARRLEREAPGVAASILEGIDEILTVARLGLPTDLRRSLACTNIIENMNGSVRRVCRNVKRWQDASMALHWTSAAMLEAHQRQHALEPTLDWQPDAAYPEQPAMPAEHISIRLGTSPHPSNDFVREAIVKFVAIVMAALGALGWPTYGNAGWFGPNDYDECILESMKGVTSDRAAGLIARSCREKFPSSDARNTPSRGLSNKERKNLTISADWMLLNGLPYRWKVEVHNGNQDITVSEMRIKLVSIISGKEAEHTYNASANIRPYNRGAFLFDVIIPERGIAMHIVEVRGY